MISELLTGDALIGALGDLLICAIVFVVVYLLCLMNNLKKDIIKNAIQDTEKMIRVTRAMKNSASRKTIERKQARKCFRRLRLLAKNNTSILRVYTYEKGADKRIEKAISILAGIEKILSDIAVAYNKDSMDTLQKVLEETLKREEMINAILSAVQKDREEAALTKI